PKAADEISFPSRMSPKATLIAEALCEGCPQATDCLLHVLANPQLYTDGVWAATTPNERKRILVQLRERLGEDWVPAALRTHRSRNDSPRSSGSRRPANHTHLRTAAQATLVVAA
ncbi:hypothetical protein E1265_18765, partial [Streptomyces sp. 8K308]|uniref:WhiB family transcriptional regulator n=1 Tax=Streptomyces sp. 8K308 TaxID=2530388 RepID=UPI0010CE58E3